MKTTILTTLLLMVTSISFAQAPTTNPTDPVSRASEDVISIYGDTYTTISGVNYDPNWGQSGHTLVNPAYDPGTGNVILAYPSFNYQGTEFPAENAANMEYLHVDIWVPAGTDRLVKVSPIDNSGNGPGEVLVEVPITPGSWNSVDLPKSAFTGMTWQSVFQLKFDGQFNGDGSANTTPFDIYLDNIYFWKEAATPESDATLNDLQVDGQTIDGFASGIQNYTYGVVEGTTTVPQITSATATNANATVTIVQAPSIPGDATVAVESEDGTNQLTYTVTFAETIPATGAPAQPTRNAADVISIFSDAYADITVDTFSADFDDSTIEDVTIDGNPAKKINFTNFIGIDFQSNRQDASEMTHFHMDFWTGETDLVGKVFNSKFSQWGGTSGEVSAFELPINTGTDPAIQTGTWVTIDVPITAFTNSPQTRDDLAQFLITSNLGEVYVDNIYLYKGESTGGGGDTAPTEAAPAPTEEASGVISLFSSVYDDVPVDTWRTDWSSATFTDSVDIAGTPVKKYADLDFVGIETVSNQIDASNMTTFHIDVWSPDFTSFSVKLVDFGADGAFGGGDDTEHQVNFTTVAQGAWVSYDIPLADFTGLTNTSNIAQLILVAQPTGSATIFVDNVYFYSTVLTSNDGTEELPNNFTLEQNYPNPFNPTTNISYTLPANAEVTLEVFNVAGQRVATLVDAFQSTGSYNVTFDASNLASGLYTYRLTTGNSVQVKKMMLIK